MEMEQGKLFIGGISWDTNEDRLKEYFGAYGEVIEAVIMRDRATGRARGFGFIVFANPLVAERVVKEKHIIDGRTVEAKKAVPRDDHHLMNRNTNSGGGSIHGSPSQSRTKKIFVGGLASTVTENDFKNYFEQFGTITDVVVMYDHNTQRPRGFGFITYDSEDAVDRVLHNTFHELNGKMVEVKRAVPKELSPGPSRSPLIGQSFGFSRTSNFLNTFPQGGYNLNSIGGYGVRMDGRYSPLSSARAGFSPFGSSSFGMGMNMEQGGNAGFGGGNANYSSNFGFSRMMNPYIGENPNRYNVPIGYNPGNNRTGGSIISSPRNLWGNSSGSTASLLNSGNGSGGGFGVLGGAIWGTSPGLSSSGYGSGNVDFRENSYPFGGRAVAGGFGRNNGATTPSSFIPLNNDYDQQQQQPYGDIYHGGGGSIYGDHRTWQSASPDIVGSASFGSYGVSDPDNATAAANATKDSEEYNVGGYGIPARQSSRGVAA